MPAAKAAGAIESSRMFLLPILLALRATEADAALIVRLQRREPQALAELYDRYGRLAYGLILRVVRDTGIAEDLVQETFLRVWNRVQGFDAQKGAIGPWLLAVARNRAIDYIRSAGGRERNNIVKAAVEKLSSHQRQVIELAYFEGLSQTEMAERMGQPLGTVKTWVRAALKTLRDELGAQAVSA